MPATKITCDQRFRRTARYGIPACTLPARFNTLSLAFIVLWTILLAVMMPVAAEAFSFDQLIKKGQQVLEDAVDEIGGSSASQQDQQSEPASDSKPPYTKDQVYKAQKYLTELGYQPGPVDGAYGSATATAISAYQADHGLPQTGVPSDELIGHMRKTLVSKPVVSAPQAHAKTESAQTAQQTSPSGGGMILSAPGGAPINANQSTQIQQTKKPMSPAAGLDPISPAGIKLGSKLSDVDATLNADSYRTINPCQYHKRMGTGNIFMTLNDGKNCDPEGPLASINYQQSGVPINETPPVLVGRISRQLGQNGQCGMVREDAANCHWNYPPKVPSAWQVSLNYDTHTPSLKYYMRAMKDPSAYRPILSPDGDYDYPDSVAPANIAIGLMADEASERLSKAHFKKMAYPDNEYQFDVIKSRERTTVQIWFGDNRSKRFDGPVSLVKYRTTRLKYVDSTMGFVDLWNRQLGTPGTCTTEDTITTCRWLEPPAAPKVHEVLLRADTGKKPELVLTVQAVSNLGTLAAKQTQSADAGPDTFSAGTGEFNPLEIFGVQVGMEFSEVKAALESRGFKKAPASCEFVKGTPGKNIEIQLDTTGKYDSRCFEGEPVHFFVAWGFQADGSLKDLVKDAEKNIGVAATCNNLTDDSMTSCNWNSFPRNPLIKQVSLDGKKTRLRLFVHGVDNLENIVKLPPKKPVPLSEQPWWTRVLAQAEAEAKTVKFTGSARYNELPPAEQSRLAEEAESVYDYCKSRQLFSSFHECRCVAGKFIDERLAREEARNIASPVQGPGSNQLITPPKPVGHRSDRSAGNKPADMDLITIADAVADQCPNKPGAALYGYNQCKNSYKIRLPDKDDLEAFCTCYGDTFATMYMNDPRAFMPNITGIGAASAMECTEQGYPSPLHR